MDLGLAGKKALVLASSKGLGLGIATRLCEEGADVLLSGRSEDRLRAAAMDLTAKGPGTAAYIVADLADPSSAAKLHEAATNRLGTVDVLVNNTGGPPPGGVEAQPLQTWSVQFQAMVLRVIDITGRCLPGMRERGWGRVLTVASSGVIQPIPNLALSNTLRSALVGWSKSLSSEVAGDGITVNILAPGRIHTERTDELDRAAATRTGKTVEEVMAAARATIPVGRYGRVDEFASVAAFLVSEPASYVTGTIIRCDGGLIRSI